MSQLSRILLLVAALFTAPAIATPKFGTMGGIGSAASTYTGGEPAGGTFSIRGDTGAATFGSVTASGAATVGSLISGAATVGGNLTVNGGQSIVQTGAAGSPRFIYSKTGTLARWGYGATGDAEAGSNAGSNFAVYRFDDTGAYLGVPLSISRATGAVTIPSLTVAGGPIAAGCANILAYGGDRTGAVDNSVAFSAAVSASPAGQACVYLPAGTYLFSSTPTISLPSGSALASAMIKGDGSGVTNIKMAAGISGPTFLINARQQTFHVRDLSVLASAAENSAAGISATMTVDATPMPGNSDISDVTVRGSDGYNATNRFATGIALSSISNMTIFNSNVSGSSGGAAYAPSNAGVCLSATGSSARVPVQLQIISTQLNYCGNGFNYGSYLQGVSIVASNFVGDNVGVYQAPSNVGNDQLAITGSQFNSYLYDLALNQTIDGLTITNSDFYITAAGSACVQMSLAGQYAITGNTFIGLAITSNGIVVSTYGIDAGIITGNQFKTFYTAVWLQSGSQYANVQSNSYINDTNTVLNSGTNNTVGGGSQ